MEKLISILYQKSNNNDEEDDSQGLTLLKVKELKEQLKERNYQQQKKRVVGVAIKDSNRRRE